MKRIQCLPRQWESSRRRLWVPRSVDAVIVCCLDSTRPRLDLDSTIPYKNPRQQLLERNLSLQSHVPTSHNKPARRARRQTANGRWVMRAADGAYFMAEGRKNQRVSRSSSSGREDETMSMLMATG